MKAPAINLDASGALVIAGVAALAVVGGVIWWKYGEQLKRGLNIASPDNFAASGVEAGLTAALGRSESAGTVAYTVSQYTAPALLSKGWRWLTGTATPDDIDYSAPVTDAERAMVGRQRPENGDPSTGLY